MKRHSKGPEKLREFMDKYGIKVYFLSRKFGISDTYLNMILRGESDPKVNIAYEIEEYTNGYVKVEDWRDFGTACINITECTTKTRTHL